MGKNQVQAQAQSVGFLLVPGFALMSYAAAVEPLRAANLISGKPLYRWWHAAPGGKPVMASNGLAIIPDAGTGSGDQSFLPFQNLEDGAGGHDHFWKDFRIQCGSGTHAIISFVARRQSGHRPRAYALLNVSAGSKAPATEAIS